MAKFKNDSPSEDESSSWIYTALGLVIIICVVAFLGFARPVKDKSADTVAVLGESHPNPEIQGEISGATRKMPTKPNLESELKALQSAEPVESRVGKMLESPKPQENMLEGAGVYVNLPFGKDAEERCSKECSQPQCFQGCARLSLSEFARRILPQDIDHKKLVKQSIKSCDKAAFLNSMAASKRAELKLLLTPVAYYEESEVYGKFSEVGPAMQNLTSNNQADPLAEAVCHYQGSLVSAFATSKAVKKRDSISETSYREYETQFLNAMRQKLTEIKG